MRSYVFGWKRPTNKTPTASGETISVSPVPGTSAILALTLRFSAWSLAITSSGGVIFGLRHGEHRLGEALKTLMLRVPDPDSGAIIFLLIVDI
jgi:hypothetical protein